MLSRTRMLLGEDALIKLKESRVAVFGAGGVGGYAIEALVRSGIGHIDVIDSDTVAESNLNRQIIALTNTLGKKKVDVVKDRAFSINPKCKVNAIEMFFLPENAQQIDFSAYDYVLDAVDTVAAKIEIVLRAKQAGVPVISAMGTGNKLDPTAFKVCDIYETKQCPLARVMRRELRARNIESLKVVYSQEPAIDVIGINGEQKNGTGGKKSVPGSVSFVPPVAGFIMAGEAIKDLCRLRKS